MDSLVYVTVDARVATVIPCLNIANKVIMIFLKLTSVNSEQPKKIERYFIQ